MDFLFQILMVALVSSVSVVLLNFECTLIVHALFQPIYVKNSRQIAHNLYIIQSRPFTIMYKTSNKCRSFKTVKFCGLQHTYIQYNMLTI